MACFVVLSNQFSHLELHCSESLSCVEQDISRLGDLGWQPKTPLEQVIREYIEWVQQQTDVSDYYAQAERVMRQQGVLRSVR